VTARIQDESEAIGCSYLGAASRHAVEHFTNHHIPEPPTRTQAITARFPDPTLTENLTLTAADLAPLPPDNDPDPPGPRRFVDLNPEYHANTEVELGIDFDL
jgi:hypothetical protein